MAQTPSATPGTPPATPATPGEPEVETEAQKAQREQLTNSACERARPVVKKLFCVPEARPFNNQELDFSQVLLLSCNYIQQYFNPENDIGPREDPDVVALSCVFLACKVAEMPRRIKNVIRAHNQVLQEEKRPELSDEKQTRLVDRMLKVEFILLRISAFHFDAMLPLQYIDEQLDRLLVGLFGTPEFVAAYPHDRKYLRKQLHNTTMRFCVDAYCGNPELSKCVETLSLGAMVFASHYVLRSKIANLPKVNAAMEKMPDVVQFMVKEELTKEQDAKVKHAIEGIMKVFKAKSSAPKKK